MSLPTHNEKKVLSLHYPFVDTLRGISILLVLILHFNLSYKLSPLFASHLPTWFYLPLIYNGNYGVVMFFVISGFLITSRTMARFGDLKEIKPRSFYSFRFARIIPNVTLMVALVLFFGALGLKIFQNDAGGPPLWLTVASIATFTHNLLMEKFGYFNYCLNILWSLSVEEVFYLLFPVVCLLCKRKKIMSAWWALFIVVAPFYRFLHRHDESDIYALYDYLAGFDGIAIGCLVALWRNQLSLSVRLRRVLLLLFAVGTATIFFSGGIFENVTFGISGVSLLLGGMLLFMPDSATRAAEKEKRPRLFHQPLQFFGRYSYELYLFHIILLALLRSQVSKTAMPDSSKPIWFLFFLILSLLSAVLISRWYAEPLNKKLRRLF